MIRETAVCTLVACLGVTNTLPAQQSRPFAANPRSTQRITTGSPFQPYRSPSLLPALAPATLRKDSPFAALNPSSVESQKGAQQLPTLDDLIGRANKGDAYAAYLVGEVYESGVYSWHHADLGQALRFYKLASDRRNLNATYRTGYLMTRGISISPITNPSYTISRGESMMRYATVMGYDPATDKDVTLPSPSPSISTRSSAASDDSLVSAIILIGAGIIAAAALSSRSSKGSGQSSNTGSERDPNRTCQIPQAVAVQNPAGSTYTTTWETRYTTAYGSQCP